MKRVLYTGSFDPITKGHMNIVSQASELFDEVVIAVLQNSSKKSEMFTKEERVSLIKQLYERKQNIQVVSGSGAAADLAILYECRAIVRGLRGIADFDYEIQLANVSREISNQQVNTIFLFADSKYQYVSSSVVKELVLLDKNISKYVDPIVENAIEAKVKKMGSI